MSNFLYNALRVTIIIGCEVSSLNDIQEGMVGKEFEPQTFI
ncbi:MULTISPECIES: hypothetical protein [unclassified Empedobacter]|nr:MULTISPECIES: hypothetical protein [unclassified Empedobacter]